jgi:hypothetical protein
MRGRVMPDRVCLRRQLVSALPRAGPVMVVMVFI